MPELDSGKVLPFQRYASQDYPMQGRHQMLSSLLKKPPGEGTGPTMHLDFRGNPVGRVPSHGERDVFERAVRPLPQRNVRAHRDVRGRGAVRAFCPDRSGTCYAS
jgi:hypothetical protein